MFIYPNDLKLTTEYAQDLYFAGEKQQAEVEFTKALALSHNDPKLIQAIEQTKKIQ